MGLLHYEQTVEPRVSLFRLRKLVIKVFAKAIWSFIKWMALQAQLVYPTRTANQLRSTPFVFQQFPPVHISTLICCATWQETILFFLWQKVSANVRVTFVSMFSKN